MDKNKKDRIRGSLIGGAIGDALGYPIEFMSLAAIRDKYGKGGITEFELNEKSKAVVSDDTQMTLFTANGLMFGVTRWANYGGLADLPSYVMEAYKEWYQTQTKVTDYNAFHTCWIRDIKELNVCRAPGNTCLSALRDVHDVNNNSKGCGGIMRVAPVALFLSAENDRAVKHGNDAHFALETIDKYAGDCAAITHKHPLGYLSAAIFVDVLYHLLNAEEKVTFEMVCNYVESALSTLMSIYTSKQEATALGELWYISKRAIDLAKKDMEDSEAIRELGEGWVAEETWAIALYCVLKHLDSFEDAVVASVNHDGDSDSTGSVCGNLMGVIVGYDGIPEKYKTNIELKNVILSIADDMIHGCNIDAYHQAETVQEKQWERRYIFANPIVTLADGMFAYTISPHFNVMEEAVRALEVKRLEDQYANAKTLEEKAYNCMDYSLKLYDNESFDPNGALVFTIGTSHHHITREFSPVYISDHFWTERRLLFRIACYKEAEPIIAIRYDKRWNDFDLAKPVEGIMRLHNPALESLYPDGGWQFYLIDKSTVSPEGYAILELLLEKEFMFDVAHIGADGKLHRIFSFNYD